MRSNKPFTNRKDNQLLPTIHCGQIFHSMPYVLYEVLIKMQYKKSLYFICICLIMCHVSEINSCYSLLHDDNYKMCLLQNII